MEPGAAKTGSELPSAGEVLVAESGGGTGSAADAVALSSSAPNSSRGVGLGGDPLLLFRRVVGSGATMCGEGMPLASAVGGKLVRGAGRDDTRRLLRPGLREEELWLATIVVVGVVTAKSPSEAGCTGFVGEFLCTSPALARTGT